MFQFVEAVKSLDKQSFGFYGCVTCRETEMVGGNGHAVIVCTMQSVLHALENERHMIRRFIPFPDVSKITMSLIEEVEEEIAGYPLVAHALCVANNLLVGIVDFAAAVDVAQNAALAVAHCAIVEDIANALIVVVVDLQTLDKSDLLAVFVTDHPIAVEEADRA